MQFIDEPRAKILLNRCNTATNSYVSVFRSLFRTLQRGMDSVGDEVKRGPAFHLDRLACMMRQHKSRHMIWRFLAPPSFPRVIWPRTADRSKHVSSQNPRADVLHPAS